MRDIKLYINKNKNRMGMLLFWGSMAMFNAQNIQMEFPHFAGKSYDFIIFQGDQQKTIYQGSIPDGGKFTLSIPNEYAHYTGMGRWLITGTKEGGGLDMLIPGHDFSVICKEKAPNENNIIYAANTEMQKLNNLYKAQQTIFARYYAMEQATRSFPKTDQHYEVFETEKAKQLKAYDNLQSDMKKNESYASKLLLISNITKGTGTKIMDTKEETARNIAAYISDELDWDALYTSGQWTEIIAAWIDIHTLVLKDNYAFVSDFAKVSSKIKNPKLYTDFAGRTAYYLNKKGKDQWIGAIAPFVTTSGKISNYEGSLAVFTKGAVGTQAPDLVITEHIGAASEHNHRTTTLKSADFAGKEYQKTLLIFYESGCGPCENLFLQLPGNYEDIKAKGVRVISLSADQDETTFKNKAKDFQWKDAFCDYDGIQGINFKNYAIAGTPTLILLDKNGKILLRTAGLGDILDYLK